MVPHQGRNDLRPYARTARYSKRREARRPGVKFLFTGSSSYLPPVKIPFLERLFRNEFRISRGRGGRFCFLSR